jgi:hypothetical protein
MCKVFTGMTFSFVSGSGLFEQPAGKSIADRHTKIIALEVNDTITFFIMILFYLNNTSFSCMKNRGKGTGGNPNAKGQKRANVGR